MAEDWAAVAAAINQRMAEIPLRQGEVIVRSGVSKSIMLEIQHNVRQRHRSARTLEALSAALDWHPRHLAAVLNGHEPPEVGAAVIGSDRDVSGRLTALERMLQDILDRLDGIDVIKGQLDQIRTDLSVAVRKNGTQ